MKRFTPPIFMFVAALTLSACNQNENSPNINVNIDATNQSASSAQSQAQTLDNSIEQTMSNTAMQTNTNTNTNIDTNTINADNVNVYANSDDEMKIDTIQQMHYGWLDEKYDKERYYSRAYRQTEVFVDKLNEIVQEQFTDHNEYMDTCAFGVLEDVAYGWNGDPDMAEFLRSLRYSMVDGDVRIDWHEGESNKYVIYRLVQEDGMYKIDDFRSGLLLGGISYQEAVYSCAREWGFSG